MQKFVTVSDGGAPFGAPRSVVSSHDGGHTVSLSSSFPSERVGLLYLPTVSTSSDEDEKDTWSARGSVCETKSDDENNENSPLMADQHQIMARHSKQIDKDVEGWQKINKIMLGKAVTSSKLKPPIIRSIRCPHVCPPSSSQPQVLEAPLIPTTIPSPRCRVSPTPRSTHDHRTITPRAMPDTLPGRPGARNAIRLHTTHESVSPHYTPSGLDLKRVRSLTLSPSHPLSLSHSLDLTPFDYRRTCTVPGYIERSSIIIALVPPCKHSDREDEVCDQSSWRGRGWCRVEFLGSSLVRSKVSVMIVEDSARKPTFILPTDSLLLPPGLGAYTCCARDHDFGGGAGSVACDKVSVAPVMSQMIDAKVDYLFSKGKIFDARVFAGIKPWIMRGLPIERSAYGLPAARALFRWRDDATEAAEASRCGVGLLFWASLNDNVEAVLELAKVGRYDQFNESSDAMRVHRPDLFGFFLRGTTALHMAVTFGSWPVVEALLGLGAAPKAVTLTGWDPLMLMCLVNRPRHITLWCERFPGWDIARRATPVGLNALAIAIVFGPNKVAAVKAMVDAGADPSRCTANTGTTVLHNVAANRDADEELVRYVLGLPGVRGLVNMRQQGRTVAWKVKYLAARMLVKLGTKKAIIKNASEWPRATPLIFAARNGNAAVIKVLVDEGLADVSLRNARGRTAIDVLVGGDDALEEIRVRLRLRKRGYYLLPT